jgi:hypothetical protein
MPAGFVRYTNFTDTFGASGVTGSIPVAAPASGNSLILVIRNSFKPGDINPISVTGFTQAIDALGRTEGNHGVFYRHNITDAPTTLTFTWAGGGDRYITYGIAEISGLTDAAPSVTAHNRIVTDGTGAISATLTGVPANSFACSFNGHGSFDITGTGDFTRTPTGATLNSFMYDLDTGAAGDKTVGFTGAANDTCAVFALAFSVAGSGPAPAVRSAVLRQLLNN